LSLITLVTTTIIADRIQELKRL